MGILACIIWVSIPVHTVYTYGVDIFILIIYIYNVNAYTVHTLLLYII